jgi:hypothetical protein
VKYSAGREETWLAINTCKSAITMATGDDGEHAIKLKIVHIDTSFNVVLLDIEGTTTPISFVKVRLQYFSLRNNVVKKPRV